MSDKCKCGLPKGHPGCCPSKATRRPEQTKGTPKRVSPKPVTKPK